MPVCAIVFLLLLNIPSLKNESIMKKLMKIGLLLLLIIISCKSENEKFINKYISGKYVDSAWSKIYKNNWDVIKNTNNSLYYEYYLGKYPKSPYYSLAENWLFENANSGHFIDKRDSKHYGWTKVNNQIWMSTQLQFNKPYRYAVYSKTELENICPDGWRLPNVEEWKKVIEYYTKQIFSGSTIISDKETFFTGACVSFKNQYGLKQKEWDFLALSTSNNKPFVFHISYTGDIDYHIYYVTERPLFDNCYVLCIKNTN